MRTRGTLDSVHRSSRCTPDLHVQGIVWDKKWSGLRIGTDVNENMNNPSMGDTIACPDGRIMHSSARGGAKRDGVADDGAATAELLSC